MRESTFNHQALSEKLTQITKAIGQVGLQWQRADVIPLRGGRGEVKWRMASIPAFQPSL